MLYHTKPKFSVTPKLRIFKNSMKIYVSIIFRQKSMDKKFVISSNLQTNFNGMRNLRILRKKVIQGNDAVFKIKKIICSNKKIYNILNPNKCQIYSIAICRVALI